LQIRNIAFRNHYGSSYSDLRRPSFLERFTGATKFGHRFLQHLLVKLKADLLDVAALLVSEQVAGTTNVEVVAGQLEACAQRVERLKNFEPALGQRGKRLAGWQSE